jgi:uncharacterized membrane protein (Fun14 family)
MTNTTEERKVKKSSFVPGLVVGGIVTLITGVALNKLAKVNITTTSTNLVDKGVSFIKGKTAKEKEAKK